MNAKRNSTRSGFTLVELLVVVAIIAILAALLVPAVASAIWSARQARIKFELDRLDHALKAFKDRYGSYPPCDLRNPASNTALKSFVAKAFPRYDINRLAGDLADTATGGTNANWGVNHWGPGADTATFRPDKALVFWLSGFAPDPAQPFLWPGTAGTPPARSAFFDFEKLRLVTDTGNMSLRPGENKYLPPSCSVPYVYFDYRIYGTISPTASATWDAGGGNHAVPYLADNDSSNNYTAVSDTWANVDSFQVISAGQDNAFGVTAGGTLRLYPTAVGYDANGADNDNVANFCPMSSLEDAKP